MENFKLQLSADLQQAIKERNLVATKTIRSLISDIDNAGAIAIENQKITLSSGSIAGASEGLGSTEVARKKLTNADVQKIIKKEIAEITSLIKYSPSGVNEYLEQINILKKYERSNCR